MCIVYKISIALLLLSSTSIVVVSASTTTQSTDTTSYFFSNKESKSILNKETTKKSDKKSNKTTYKLTGILFINNKNWTVWINDKPYSSIGQHEEFSINFVSKHSVNLTLDDGRSITLLLDT